MLVRCNRIILVITKRIKVNKYKYWIYYKKEYYAFKCFNKKN